MRRRWRASALAALLVLAGASGACTADEITSNQCPALCPGREVAVIDTTLEAIVLDTVLSGFPVFGTEPVMLLAAEPGGALDVRGLIRYDSVVTQFAPTFGDTIRPVTDPDSARIVLRLDTLNTRATAPVTVEVFDVDSAVADTLTSALAPLFRLDRRLGVVTVEADSLTDSLAVPLDGLALAAVLERSGRVRIGLRVSSPAPVALAVGTTDGLRDPRLRYKPSADSTVGTFSFPPRSSTPADVGAVAASLADYTWVVAGSPAPPAGEIGIGGAPGRRSYLAITLPTDVVDSTNVVRATLELVQRPYVGPRSRDTLSVYPLLVVTGTTADVRRSTALAIPAVSALRSQLGLRSFTDSLAMAVTDSGRRQLDITAAVREWRLSGVNGMRRAIVLRTGPEGFEAGQLRFFSREAPAEVRPRLRIVYTARPGSGLP